MFIGVRKNRYCSRIAKWLRHVILVHIFAGSNPATVVYKSGANQTTPFIKIEQRKKNYLTT